MLTTVAITNGPPVLKSSVPPDRFRLPVFDNTKPLFKVRLPPLSVKFPAPLQLPLSLPVVVAMNKVVAETVVSVPLLVKLPPPVIEVSLFILTLLWLLNVAVAATFKLAAASALKLPVLVKVWPASIVRSPADQFTVPVLFQLRARVMPATLFSVVVALVVSKPPPARVPPFQLKAPLKVIAAAVLKVPPFRIKAPSRIELLVSVKVPAPSVNDAVEPRTSVFASAFALIVTFAVPAMLASSVLTGMRTSQFAGSFQSTPSPAPVQRMTIAPVFNTRLKPPAL